MSWELHDAFVSSGDVRPPASVLEWVADMVRTELDDVPHVSVRVRRTTVWVSLVLDTRYLEDPDDLSNLRMRRDLVSLCWYFLGDQPSGWCIDDYETFDDDAFPAYGVDVYAVPVKVRALVKKALRHLKRETAIQASRAHRALEAMSPTVHADPVRDAITKLHGEARLRRDRARLAAGPTHPAVRRAEADAYDFAVEQLEPLLADWPWQPAASDTTTTEPETYARETP